MLHLFCYSVNIALCEAPCNFSYKSIHHHWFIMNCCRAISRLLALSESVGGSHVLQYISQGFQWWTPITLHYEVTATWLHIAGWTSVGAHPTVATIYAPCLFWTGELLKNASDWPQILLKRFHLLHKSDIVTSKRKTMSCAKQSTSFSTKPWWHPVITIASHPKKWYLLFHIQFQSSWTTAAVCSSALGLNFR